MAITHSEMTPIKPFESGDYNEVAATSNSRFNGSEHFVCERWCRGAGRSDGSSLSALQLRGWNQMSKCDPIVKRSLFSPHWLLSYAGNKSKCSLVRKLSVGANVVDLAECVRCVRPVLPAALDLHPQLRQTWASSAELNNTSHNNWTLSSWHILTLINTNKLLPSCSESVFWSLYWLFLNITQLC